jgi:hypothetical protein
MYMYSKAVNLEDTAPLPSIRPSQPCRIPGKVTHPRLFHRPKLSQLSCLEVHMQRRD